MFSRSVGGLFNEDAEEVGDDYGSDGAENCERDDGDSWIGEVEEGEEDSVVDQIHTVGDSSEILRNGGVEAKFEARVLHEDDDGGHSEHREEVAAGDAGVDEHGVAIEGQG